MTKSSFIQQNLNEYFTALIASISTRNIFIDNLTQISLFCELEPATQHLDNNKQTAQLPRQIYSVIRISLSFGMLTVARFHTESRTLITALARRLRARFLQPHIHQSLAGELYTLLRQFCVFWEFSN